MVGIAPILFVFWKVVKRTKFVKSSKADLVWEAPASLLRRWASGERFWASSPLAVELKTSEWSVRRLLVQVQSREDERLLSLGLCRRLGFGKATLNMISEI